MYWRRLRETVLGHLTSLFHKESKEMYSNEKSTGRARKAYKSSSLLNMQNCDFLGLAVVIKEFREL